jgi:hypothetical protein
MTATAAEVWAALTPEPTTDEKIERDKKGRYLLPDPTTGEIRPWSRVTSFADTLADRRGLEKWSQRNIVRGIGAREDLWHLATAAGVDDRKMLDDIIDQAEATARANAGSNSGSALHRLTERLDRGEDVPIPNPKLRADVAAYRTAMAAKGLRVARDQDTGTAWIERVLIIPELNLAGMCDRLLIGDDYVLPVLGDLKSGKNALKAMDSIPLQLAIYSRAAYWYDPDTRKIHEMPEVDQDRAIVMHLPLGRAHCELLEVDIKAGWEAVQLALEVRRWRSRKDLAQIITSPAPPVTTVAGTDDSSGGAAQGDPPAPPPAATTLLEQRTTWLRQRVTAIIDAGHEADLAERWPAGVPTLRQGGLTDQQVTAVAAVCDTVEALHGLPFGPADPAYGNRATNDEPQHVSNPLGELLGKVFDAAAQAGSEAREYAAAGRQLLAQFDNEAERRAVADCALADGLMTADKLTRLEAVAGQVADPIGAVWFHYGAHTCEVRPSDSAVTAMVAGATGGDPQFATTGRTHALTRAKRLARQLELPAPRSLAQAAENALLAALVAAGHGTADTNDSQENTQP